MVFDPHQKNVVHHEEKIKHNFKHEEFDVFKAKQGLVDDMHVIIRILRSWKV